MGARTLPTPTFLIAVPKPVTVTKLALFALAPSRMYRLPPATTSTSSCSRFRSPVAVGSPVRLVISTSVGSLPPVESSARCVL